jgi:hypothetical protein
MFKKLLLVFVIALSGVAGAQTTGFAASDITSAYGSAITGVTPMIAAAGLGGLALWGLRTPVRIGIAFLRSLFK